MNNRQRKNIAFIDGQNLYMATARREVDPWRINLARFRVYLEQKYDVSRAYYHLGYMQEEHQELYEQIQNAGFVIVFKKHNSVMAGLKKGNVDSDIIFYAMKRLHKKEDFEKIIIVSGDGDYKLLVDFLIEENKFSKILFPDKKFASSLYKQLGSEYYDYLENKDVKNKIQAKRKGLLR